MASISPEKALRHVLAISSIDGWSIAIIAGVGGIVSLLLGSWIGVGVGATLALAGALELHGRRRLLRGEPDGLNGLIAAQLVILATIVAYAFSNIVTFNEAAIVARITPGVRSLLWERGVRLEDIQPLLKPLYLVVYSTVIGLTVIFQGGLALFYHVRRGRIAMAIQGRGTVPPPLPLA